MNCGCVFFIASYFEHASDTGTSEVRLVPLVKKEKLSNASEFGLVMEPASSTNMQSMTVEELRNWLEGKGILESYCQIFAGELINLCAVVYCVHLHTYNIRC